uniref:DUF4455 domain-containing protein n=1 Tax=Timema poppense TaxID=170557 RepID=A0A7R9HFY1_TIMPO|nr:unnamed protein product [Timema poppensis]
MIGLTAAILAVKDSSCQKERNYFNLEVQNLEEEAFSHCWEQIRILSNKKKECIKEYRERVVELENSRSGRIKEILKKHYGELRDVHHLLPRDLQNFFEHEILKINQLILNNMRCYDDVTSHLTSIGDKKMLETLNYLDYRKRKGLIRKKDLDNLDSEYVSTTILLPLQPTTTTSATNTPLGQYWNRVAQR